MPGKSYQKQMTIREYEDHMKRISSMKSVIDSKPPKISKLDNKKKDIERRRHYASIEMDNRLLLERLVKTMQNKTIDNENKTCKKYSKSLISTSRKLELQRITQENQRLLKRIQETEPCYNHLIWEEEAKKREYYKRNMSEFHDLIPPSSSSGHGINRLYPPRDDRGIIPNRNKSATVRKVDESSLYAPPPHTSHTQQRQHQQQSQGQRQSQGLQSRVGLFSANASTNVNGTSSGNSSSSGKKLRPLSAPRPRISSTEYL
jgi:hypothetical protein